MAYMELRGMKRATRNRIQHRMNSLPSHENISFPKFVQLSVREYNALRDQLKDMSSVSKSKAPRKVTAKSSNTLKIGDPIPRLLFLPS